MVLVKTPTGLKEAPPLRESGVDPESEQYNSQIMGSVEARATIGLAPPWGSRAPMGARFMGARTTMGVRPHGGAPPPR